MIGLDTNVLIRYFIQDEGDAETIKQQKLAKKLIESKKSLMVCKTVLLELEWVMRGYYGFKNKEILNVFHHLLSRSNIEIEDRAHVAKAISIYQEDMDFGDALHHASYQRCKRVISFDDNKFASMLFVVDKF